MLKNACLAAVFAAAVAAPAWAADQCGPMPIAPAFPATAAVGALPVEAARAQVVDSYHNVKTYQLSLQSYRACLMRTTKEDTAAIAAADPEKDEAKVKQLKEDIADRQKLYDKTVDGEQQLVADFNTLHVAHCARDTDPKICPQKK
jgi:hypothetical protein